MNFVAENALDGALEELQRQATIIIFSNYLITWRNSNLSSRSVIIYYESTFVKKTQFEWCMWNFSIYTIDSDTDREH